MVASSSFDTALPPINASLRTGAAGNVGTRPPALQGVEAGSAQQAQTPERPPATGPDAPVRGDRPVSQNLSTPFVAQFIAQEIDPAPAAQRSRAETSRAFDAFRQAQASADLGQNSTN